MTKFLTNLKKVHTEKINKIALSNNDDKRIQTTDKITTYPYGMKLDDTETNQIIISSQKLREESEKSRKESSQIIISSQNLREELKSVRKESVQIVARSQKLREESKSSREKSRNETDQIIARSQKLREESEKCRKESSEIIIRSQKLREEPKSLREISKSLREKSRNETDWIIENQKSNLMILLCFQNCSDLEMKHNNTEMKHCNTKMKCL